MAVSNTGVFPTLYYPKDIASNSIYQYRNVKILVKEQDTFSGAVEELKTKMKAVVAQGKEVASNASDYFSGNTTDLSNDLPGKNIKELSQAKTIFGFCLPLPGELLDQQGHNWNTTTSMVGETLNSAISTIPGSNIAMKIGSELSAAVAFRKPIIDPGYFQDYTGTTPRSFVLSFTLIPNNIEEAKSIMEIIYNLKKYTLPTTVVTGLALRSPYVFDLEIGNPWISTLINMKGVVCTNMSVSYGADGAMQFFADGIPKMINLSLGFTERYLVTADMY